MSIKTRTQLVIQPSGTSSCRYKVIGQSVYNNTDTTSCPGITHAPSESIETFNGKDGRFRPCKHDSVNFTRAVGTIAGSPGIALPRPPVNPVMDVIVNDYGWGSSPITQTLSRALAIPTNPLSDSQFEAYSLEAFEKMLPSMDTGFSLINFILELKDFRDVFRGLKGWNLSSFRSHTLRLHQRLRDFTRRVRGSEGLPYRELSKLVLFKEFGLDPLISDLGKVFQGITSFRRRLAELRSRAGIAQVRHYSRNVSGAFPTEYVVDLQGAVTSWLYQGIQHGVGFQRRLRWLTPPKFTATVRYMYTVPDLDSKLNQLDALLDTLGLKADPSIIWNAIPFSFVVDWFVDVGGFLRRFSSDTLDIDIVINDFCCSLKSSFLLDTRFWHYRMPGGGFPFSEGIPVTGCQVYRKSYLRRVGVPNVLSAAKLNGLDWRKFLLGSALVMANKPRFKKTNTNK